MNSDDVKAGLVQPKWHEHERVSMPPGLQVNEVTLRERQVLNELKGGASKGYAPITRAEAERVGYRPDDIAAWFGGDDGATDHTREVARLLAEATAKTPTKPVTPERRFRSGEHAIPQPKSPHEP